MNVLEFFFNISRNDSKNPKVILKCSWQKRNICEWLVKCKKVKCTLVQALRLCTSRTAYRGSRGIALPIHDHGSRRGRGVNVTPPPLFTPRKDPVSIVQEAGCTSGPVWTCAKNFAPTGNRSSDRPALRQSLYRLSYSNHWIFSTGLFINETINGEFLKSKQ
jgi:hypothetical protein